MKDLSTAAGGALIRLRGLFHPMYLVPLVLAAMVALAAVRPNFAAAAAGDGGPAASEPLSVDQIGGGLYGWIQALAKWGILGIVAVMALQFFVQRKWGAMATFLAFSVLASMIVFNPGILTGISEALSGTITDSGAKVPGPAGQ